MVTLTSLPLDPFRTPWACGAQGLLIWILGSREASASPLGPLPASPCRLGREHHVAVPSQLRLAVVEALGPMSHLLPSERLEEQLPKLLPAVLALYKKHAETCHVSKVRLCPLRPVQSSVH